MTTAGRGESPFPSPALYHKLPDGASVKIFHIILDILQTAGLILLAWLYYRKYKEED